MHGVGVVGVAGFEAVRGGAAVPAVLLALLLAGVLAGPYGVAGGMAACALASGEGAAGEGAVVGVELAGVR